MDSVGNPPAQKRFGPILLSPGYGPIQVISFLFVLCVSYCMNEFSNAMLPLLLREQLHVPAGQQGGLTGALGATQQVGTLICILFAGALADIYGRRIMLILTMIGFTICLVFYPLISVVFGLFAVKFLWGVAYSGYNAGAPTLSIDIPDNNSRGKFNSLVLLTPILATSGFVLYASKLPAWFQSMGHSPHISLVGSYWLIAILPVICIITTITFLKEPKRPAVKDAGGGVLVRVKGLVSNLRSVLAYAGQNKTFGLIIFIGSVVRTDTVIIGTFLALWIVNAGRLEGIDAIQATKTVGLIVFIRFITKVIGAPLFGLIADKVNRTTLVLVALAMMTLAFSFFGLIHDAFGIWMIVAAALIGFAESAEGIASQSLMAQEAPAHLRGSSVGIFTFLGTLSLMIVNLLGGYLFDKLGYASPMLMEAVLHLIVLVVSLLLLRKNRAGTSG
jgi:MFS family permease